jgi:1-acyl-sn-glycerol-3-phosphate acyltransferase
MQTLEKPLEQKSAIVTPSASRATSAINCATTNIASVPARAMTIASGSGEVIRNLLLFPVLRLYTRPEVYGDELLSDTGPYLFAVNHCSHLDAPLLLAALPRSLRLHLRVAAATDYFFDRPWKGALMKVVLNAFPFVRKGPHCSDSLEQAKQLLAAGYSVLLFPEGTRSKDGRLQPFKHGIGRLALSGLAPVVPVWIEGAYAAMPKGARWPRRQRVVVRFGTPLTFSSEESVSAIVAEIERQVGLLQQR